jgi:NADH:ubiquinone oxidoreductase subunit 5 (subunit L)/multisubunit Na+/H+ antiporter MnhA subunit
LLIGFWFHRKSAADAAKKAFIVTRIGDFGFLLAGMTMFWYFGSLQFGEVVRDGGANRGGATRGDAPRWRRLNLGENQRILLTFWNLTLGSRHVTGT